MNDPDPHTPIEGDLRSAQRRSPWPARAPRDAEHSDLGQATAEYALVLLGAAAIALILLAWATGAGGGRITGLLNHVVAAVSGHVKS